MMPRAKKDGQHINCYIDRTLCERLKAYADEKDCAGEDPETTF